MKIERNEKWRKYAHTRGNTLFPIYLNLSIKNTYAYVWSMDSTFLFLFFVLILVKVYGKVFPTFNILNRPKKNNFKHPNSEKIERAKNHPNAIYCFFFFFLSFSVNSFNSILFLKYDESQISPVKLKKILTIFYSKRFNNNIC